MFFLVEVRFVWFDSHAEDALAVSGVMIRR
jgi:hypothetical protein